ncbi:hypothetical protein TcasGA2_TC002474 [Tribolium castaneum]|uniref:Uncharacterized protein n=1 Tax=Tribolium castaneum TaxID=7070 RepID=D6WHY6_TRICA|nr:hypothetical protein TcasGA2_TC002474 [Tribolium castaneum]
MQGFVSQVRREHLVAYPRHRSRTHNNDSRRHSGESGVGRFGFVEVIEINSTAGLINISWSFRFRRMNVGLTLKVQLGFNLNPVGAAGTLNFLRVPGTRTYDASLGKSGNLNKCLNPALRPLGRKDNA